MRRLLVGFGIVMATSAVGVSAAGACGFLVAANGGVQLQRTTTLAAFHNGVEHYVTSFAFASSAPEFGSIIPLPGKPTLVERAGNWTLQRLEREVNPVEVADESLRFAAAPTTGGVAVISTTQIDSLTVTVVKGGGADVAQWAKHNGFALPADTPAALEFYSRRSPFFALAKFDARKAQAKGFNSGDGIPVHIAMPVKNPWVPLHILAAAKPGAEIVSADVFLLTDHKPTMLTGAGLDLARSEPASDLLLNDLRNDKHSAWIPQRAWLTFLKVNVEAKDLSFDLAVDATGGSNPSVIDTGIVTLADTHKLHTLVATPIAKHVSWSVALFAAAVVFFILGLGAWTFTLRPRSVLRPAA